MRGARSTKCATALRRRDLLPKEGTSLLGHGKSSCLIPSSRSECETKKSAWRNLAARQLPRYFLARSPLYLAVVLCHHQSWKEKVPVTFFLSHSAWTGTHAFSACFLPLPRHLTKTQWVNSSGLLLSCPQEHCSAGAAREHLQLQHISMEQLQDPWSLRNSVKS